MSGHLEPMKLLPCRPDVCQECAVDHEQQLPHDAQSLYYQYKFYGEYGRWPTWKDAVAHCHKKVRDACEAKLREMGEWTEPIQENTR